MSVWPKPNGFSTANSIARISLPVGLKAASPGGQQDGELEELVHWDWSPSAVPAASFDAYTLIPTTPFCKK